MLIDILKDIASRRGEDPSDSDIREMLVFRINKAAREIHDKTDIQEAMDEMIVDINQQSQQVALPTSVYQVRGMRQYDPRRKVLVDDIKNRYNFENISDTWPLNWRQKRVSPIMREIANQSIIKVTIPKVEATDLQVTITGRTEHSHRASEAITIPAGSLEAEGALNFEEPIDSITKNRASLYDVTILDVNENILSVIPNTDTKISYKIFQVLDSDVSNSTLTSSNHSAIEVLYKVHFIPASNDQDSFWNTDKYDNAIMFKYLELYGNTEEAILNHTKSANDIAEIQDGENVGVREKMDFKRPVYFELPYQRMGPDHIDTTYRG